MSNFEKHKIQIFPGINDLPRMPTSTHSGNGSDMIARHNGLMDKLTLFENRIIALEPPYGILMRFDGPHGSKDLALSSIGDHTYDMDLDVKISGQYEKIGGPTCLMLRDGALRITPNPSNNLDLSDKDFTIEFWFRDNGTSQDAAIIAWSTEAYPLTITKRGFSFGNETGWIIRNLPIYGSNTSNMTPVPGWGHFAVTRKGNTFRTFNNGILVATATSSAKIGLPGTITIGGEWGMFVNGGFDHFSVRHFCKYEATFNLVNPTYEDVDPIESLDHQSFDDSKGLFYWLGTDGYTKTFDNPNVSGKCIITASGSSNDSTVERLVDRDLSTFFYTNEVEQPFLHIDLKDKVIVLKSATIALNEATLLYDLQIRGSNSFGASKLLGTLSRDHATTDPDHWVHVPVTDQFFGFRYIIIGAINSSGVPHPLTVSQIELYGDVYPI